MKTKALVIAVSLTVPITFAFARQTSDQGQTKSSEAACPIHSSQTEMSRPSSAMNERGEKGMGFSQTATTHHFFLKPNGGVIQVEVNDPTDAADRDSIRKHLTHIARAFSEGDFDIPMFVHDTVPPGVPEMKRLRESIEYSFEKTASGGRVIISTADSQSVAAVHSFLRFQIEEHKTGDPVDIR